MRIYLWLRFAAITITTASVAFGIAPNPIISRNKPVFTSSGSQPILVDGKFSSSAVWTVQQNGAWAAINVGEGPQKVFISWNTTNYMWSDSLANPGNCIKGFPVPTAYRILTSSNSTNGEDGAWEEKAAITGNVVAARGHIVESAGNAWVKLVFDAVINSRFDEIEVFDASAGADDTWLFVGTSITAGTFKDFNLEKTFGDYITEGNSAYTPACVRAGIGCITVGGLRNDIARYVNIAEGIKHFAIEIGTNDAWGGDTSGLRAYTVKLQRVIDTCKAYGIEPVIARILATDSAKAGWQVHGDFLKVVDSLVEVNGLSPGPDLNTYFLAHPEEFKSDGVHPGEAGAASIQRLWAETILTMYQGSGIERNKSTVPVKNHSTIAIRSVNNRIVFSSFSEGSFSLFALSGRCVTHSCLQHHEHLEVAVPTGCYLVKFSPVGGQPLLRTIVHR